jgi:hypothetical protein
MSEEKYEPTLADKLLYTNLQATQAGQTLLQLRVDGEISHEAYSKLYDLTSEVARLLHLLEEEARTGKPSPYFFPGKSEE